MRTTAPTTTPSPTSSASLASTVGIEARRFARHPAFLVGLLATLAVSYWAFFIAEKVTVAGDTYTTGALSGPVIPAFFLGLPSLVVAARLTRSTESSVEVLGAAPGAEHRRTLAVAGACLVPFTAGLVWLGLFLATTLLLPVHPKELWFPTVGDLWVWSIMLALGPVACLGAALLGVLVGRWLRFPGATAVAVVALVALCIGLSALAASPDLVQWRTVAPWTLWHSGSATAEGDPPLYPAGTQAIYPGNPFTYLLYTLTLCALAVVGAVWHDRSARTSKLRVLGWGLVVVAVALYRLSAMTGFSEPIVSEVFPKEAL